MSPQHFTSPRWNPKGQTRLSFGNMWVILLGLLMEQGQERDTRAGKTKELICFSEVFEDPHFQTVGGRGGSLQFALIEQLCYLAGEDSEILAQNFPGFRKYQEPEGHWHGAYGPRLRIQLEAVVYELDHRRNSRRGVALIYRPEDTLLVPNPIPPNDIPCTICLNFWINDNQLNCHAFMRSTDIWKGLFYDVPAFHAIQSMMASALLVSEGPLWFTTTSLHIYEEHWGKARSISGDVPLSSVLEWPEGLFESNLVDPLSRLAEMTSRAGECLQSFYKLGASLGGGRATIGQSS